MTHCFKINVEIKIICELDVKQTSKHKLCDGVTF